MATFRFIREQGTTSAYVTYDSKGRPRQNNEIRFDSSPKASICKHYGWDEEKFELRNERQEGNTTLWDVFGGLRRARKPHKLGVLQYQPPSF